MWGKGVLEGKLSKQDIGSVEVLKRIKGWPLQSCGTWSLLRKSTTRRPQGLLNLRAFSVSVQYPIFWDRPSDLCIDDVPRSCVQALRRKSATSGCVVRTSGLRREFQTPVGKKVQQTCGILWDTALNTYLRYLRSFPLWCSLNQFQNFLVLPLQKPYNTHHAKAASILAANKVALFFFFFFFFFGLRWENFAGCRGQLGHGYVWRPDLGIAWPQWCWKIDHHQHVTRQINLFWRSCDPKIW